MSDIKIINISRDAAATLGNIPRKGRRTTKKNVINMDNHSNTEQTGGSNIHGVSHAMNIIKGNAEHSIASSSASTNSNSWLQYPSGAPVPPQINFKTLPSHTPISTNISTNISTKIDNNFTQEGGVRQIKVELKKKTTSKKVNLNPKRSEPAKMIPKKNHTKKSRKITLGISNLHKRITRAKKAHNKVKGMPLEELREYLIKNKLIKATSKAPESVLRQIAIDTEVVKNKAL